MFGSEQKKGFAGERYNINVLKHPLGGYKCLNGRFHWVNEASEDKSAHFLASYSILVGREVGVLKVIGIQYFCTEHPD